MSACLHRNRDSPRDLHDADRARNRRRFRDGQLGDGPLGRQIRVESCCFQDAFYFKIVISVCSPMIQ